MSVIDVNQSLAVELRQFSLICVLCGSSSGGWQEFATTSFKKFKLLSLYITIPNSADRYTI